MKVTCFLLLVLNLNTHAQEKLVKLTDTLPVKVTFKKTVLNKKTVNQQTTDAEIETRLNGIVSRYLSHPYTPATWSQIKKEAEDMLYTYLQRGLLMGTKPEQAYFVKIGSDTMTQADIANKKIVLIAGIASIKPSEFTIIRIEKIGTGY